MIRTDKRLPLSEAAALVKPGDTLALGGLTLYRRPVAFVYELLRRAPPPDNLTLLCYTASYESDLLVGAGLVKRVRSCYFGFEAFGLAPMFTEAAQRGAIEVIEESEASLAFGLRATLAGIGFMPARAWLGTDLPRLRPDVRTIRDPYTDEELMAFPAVSADVAVIHAVQADPFGNAILNNNLGVDLELAMAAKTVIVTAEEIVPPHSLTRADMPGPTVTAVAHAPRGAWPTSCHPLYPMAGGEILKYLDVNSPETFAAYIKTTLSR